MTNIPHYTVKLNILHCYRQDEGDGDELFLKHKNERVWPFKSKYEKVKEGDTKIEIDITGIEKGQTIELELWDYDFLTPNDKLGVFHMLVNERGGPFTTDLTSKTHHAKYSVEWEVH